MIKKIARRKFLSDSVGAAAALAAVSSLAIRSTPTSPNDELAVAVIGVGGLGSGYNFLDCVRTRQEPAAPAEVVHLSCSLIHLGETAYRVGRVLHFDPEREQIIDDAEANALLTKEYRDPWKMPDPV